MKVRRVIGTAKVETPFKCLQYDEKVFQNIKPETEIELAVYEEVKPKRRLVVPEGVDGK